MDGLQIRRATENDISDCGHFYEQAVQIMIKTATNYPKWRADYPCTQSVRESVTKGEQYLCEMNGKIYGAFVLNENPNGAYENGDWGVTLERGKYLIIHTLATDQSMTGKGIGSAMVSYCLEYARNNGYKAVRVDVVPDNFPARRLYEKQGFRFAGEFDLERGISDIPMFALYEYNI